jgi:hypothetical protein
MKIISIAVVLVLSLMVAQAAKADEILFNDLGDTISVSPSSNPPVAILLGCQTGVQNADICSVTLLRAGQTITAATGNFTINLNTATPVQATYLLSEDANKTLLSDTFISTIVPGVKVLGVTTLPGAAAFVFDSDLPALEGVSVLCPAVIGCNAAETGGPQLVGSITWSNGITDTISIESDKEGVVPEPASLLLLGSGLAMTGGFLRRRLRLA